MDKVSALDESISQKVCMQSWTGTWSLAQSFAQALGQEAEKAEEAAQGLSTKRFDRRGTQLRTALTSEFKRLIMLPNQHCVCTADSKTAYRQYPAHAHRRVRA